MPKYPYLESLMTHLDPIPSNSSLLARVHREEQTSYSMTFADEVIPYLVATWLDDYESLGVAPNVVETSVSNFSYLFDCDVDRLVAAWGISQGRHGEARDKSRMAGHPMSDGPHYHRGHAIPHTLGGPTDINLVPQLGSVNIGSFRALEREAVRTPGSLYFTYWIYRDKQAQKPDAVQQGLLCPGYLPLIYDHPN